MLTRDEAEQLTRILEEHGSLTDEERSDESHAELILAIARVTAPESPAVPEPFLPTFSRTSTRDFEFESVTQPIPLETSKALVDRLRRSTKDLES